MNCTNWIWSSTEAEMEMRQITDIQREIYRQLAINGSYLTDSTPGSVLYSLTRSFAAAALAGDQLLFDLSQDFFLSTARGERLDHRAAEYGVFRRQATYAQGYVLVRPREGDLVLGRGAVFIEPIRGTQFLSTLNREITIPEEVEVKVPVVAARPGKEGNLPAGTRLILTDEMDAEGKVGLAVEVTVGISRNLQGEVTGQIIGGADEESDEQLRTRVRKQLLTRNSCTEEVILNLLYGDHRVNWATVHIPFPGHTQVWVELGVSDVEPVLNDLTNLVNQVRPVGTSLSVHQIYTSFVDFEVHFSETPSTDFNILNKAVEDVLWSYCYGLKYQEPLRRSSLIYLLKQIDQAKFLRLAQPETDLQPPLRTALRPGSIKVRHSLQ
jgi:hypothetical protein